MVVQWWSPVRLASVALAVLFLPLTTATPEVRDTSEATVFVDGNADYFEFAGLGVAFYVGQSWSITAPDGLQAFVISVEFGARGQPTSFFLDGTPRGGSTSDWMWIGDLSNAAADGTWLIRSTYIDSTDQDTNQTERNPGPTLSVQGKAIHWTVESENPQTFNQLWNWHMTTGTWNEPSTVPDSKLDTVDSPVEGFEEDPQFARFFAPLADPVSQSVSGDSESQTIPGQDIDTPPFTIPATCVLGPCNSETPLGSTPPATIPATCTLAPCQSETPLVTPAQPVPETCVPLLLCVGPFTIPAQDLGDAPAVCDAAEPVCVGPIPIPAQNLGEVPAVCDVAGEICVGPFPVPAQDVVETPPVTVAVDFTGLDAAADPNAGEIGSIGPIVQVIPVPIIGDVPVTICPTTCPFPVSPEGETVGSLTITVTVGSEEESYTIPLGQSV
ncbi:MAG: hypothetical protein ACYC2H_03035 [Thermoplasmatota archaeon]